MISVIVHFLSIVGATVAIGAMIDRVMKPEHRDSISSYLFGSTSVSFSNFELSAIRGLLSVYNRADGKVSFFRILLVSTAIYALLIAGSSSATGGFVAINSPDIADRTGAAYWVNLIGTVALPIALLCMIPDLFSLWVSQQFFVKRSPQFPATLYLTACDIALSSGLFLGGTILVLHLLPALSEHGFASYMLTVAAMSGLRASVHSFLFLAIILLGASLRGLASITHINRKIAQYTVFDDYPVTFLFIVFGLFLFALDPTP